MKYRNVKTGAEIDAPCVIAGGDWRPVEKPKKPKKDTSSVTPDGATPSPQGEG